MFHFVSVSHPWLNNNCNNHLCPISNPLTNTTSTYSTNTNITLNKYRCTYGRFSTLLFAKFNDEITPIKPLAANITDDTKPTLNNVPCRCPIISFTVLEIGLIIPSGKIPPNSINNSSCKPSTGKYATNVKKKISNGGMAVKKLYANPFAR